MSKALKTLLNLEESRILTLVNLTSRFQVMSSVYARAGSVVSEIDECCPEHSDLLELIKLSGLYNKLDKEGPFTLLAPNNG